MTKDSHDFRGRIYEEFGTRFQDASPQFDRAAADRWGRAYDHHLRGWLPEDKSAPVLELASGIGWLLHFFRERGYTHLTGLDISPEQVELAKQVHPNVHEGDALQFLAAHPGEFGLIVAMDLIEHLPKTLTLPFLDACVAALRPGGRLILQTPNADTPFGLQMRYGDFTHETCFSPTSLRRLMGLCGYTNVSFREGGPAPVGVKSAVRWAAWRGIRACFKGYNLVETGKVGPGIFTRVFLASGCRAPA